jgi:CheY-like chemotaxis protein/anti-sigma regulatory factor (Ser/Thr protein kinase)
VTRFEPAPPAAIAERRLAQVLVNLLVNACQAIPEGRAAENEIGVSVREEAGRVVVEVSDTGEGMTPEVRRRAFEPFFTTRPVGEGMGLGLALSHTMVAEAGGELEVESTPGRGSVFRLRLPATAAVEDRPAPPPAPAEPGADGETRRLRVLLVDDEPLVARAVARQLREFDVDVETSAAAALERVRGGAGYDAVVCDLMMPDATGMDLHARVAAEAPAVASRFVFLTGGAFTDRARSFVATTRAPVLEKPVDAAALRAAVRAVAASRRGGAPA